MNMSDTPQPSAAPAEGQIDFRVYWRVIQRRRWLILGLFMASVLLAAAYSLRLPRIYQASATLLIEASAPKPVGGVTDVADSTSGVYWFNKEYYETQYNVVRSRAVAARVASLITTARDDHFLALDSVPSEEARASGLKALAALRQTIVSAPEPANVLMGRIQVEPVKDSRIAKLSVEDPDPVLAAALTNAFAQAYMEFNLAAKSVTTEKAFESVALQLPDLEAKLEKSSAEFAQFKKKHNIVSTSWEDKQNIISQRITRLSEELTTVQLRKSNVKARLDSILLLQKDKEGGDATRLLLPSALAGQVTLLRQRVTDIRGECAELQERLLDQHPRMLTCRQKLKFAENALENEVETALAAAKADYAEVLSIEKSLQANISEAKAEALATLDYEPEYLKLKRSHEYNLKLYDVALKSLKEGGLSSSTRMNNISMLDAAQSPTGPSKPNVRNILLMGALIGLLLGLGLAFGLEFLDNTLTTQQQVEEGLGVAFLGILPSYDSKGSPTPDLVVAEQPKSAIAECCRAIRTNLLFMSPDKPLKSILVTSAGPREGKTTTAASLAITMARSGNRVLLVDADLRRPRVHSAFKIPNAAGLSSLILGQGTLSDTVRSSGVDGLSLLTCGPVPPNPSELLHTQAFAALLREMTTTYDRVIIDSPPVAAVSDAVVVSTQVDGTVLVLKAGETAKDVAKRMVRVLRDVKANIFGALLNDIDLEDRQAGGYYYYSKYGYYYGESEGAPKNGSVA